MKSKKETLIEALYGSFMFLDNLPDLISKENIYDEKGYVDIEFLTAILTWMSRMSTISTNINKSLYKLLGCDEVVPHKKTDPKTDPKGESWSVEEILKNCILCDNVIKLPDVKLSKNAYLEAKKWIEEAGGHWVGGKVNGFAFEFDAKRVFDILHDGKRCNLKQEFQYFETPPKLADWLVKLAGGIKPDDNVLEPSAGQGGLVKAVHRSCSSVVVDCFELMPENKEILSKIEYVNIIGDDFTKGCSTKYTKIIANPPFSKNQDVRHVKIMYNYLADGGTLATIMSRHWLFSCDKECVKFREWLDDIGGSIYDIPAGEFSESGTNIQTTAVIIKK